MAPAVAAATRLKSPSETRYPANGMMISEGSGMQADSIAIISTMPPSPRAEIVATMKAASAPIIPWNKLSPSDGPAGIAHYVPAANGTALSAQAFGDDLGRAKRRKAAGDLLHRVFEIAFREGR